MELAALKFREAGLRRPDRRGNLSRSRTGCRLCRPALSCGGQERPDLVGRLLSGKDGGEVGVRRDAEHPAQGDELRISLINLGLPVRPIPPGLGDMDRELGGVADPSLRRD